jgi:hypothetical protein
LRAPETVSHPRAKIFDPQRYSARKNKSQHSQSQKMACRNDQFVGGLGDQTGISSIPRLSSRVQIEFTNEPELRFPAFVRSSTRL